jgi:hypothetical protein
MSDTPLDQEREFNVRHDLKNRKILNEQKAHALKPRPGASQYQKSERVKNPAIAE